MTAVRYSPGWLELAESWMHLLEAHTPQATRTFLTGGADARLTAAAGNGVREAVTSPTVPAGDSFHSP